MGAAYCLTTARLVPRRTWRRSRDSRAICGAYELMNKASTKSNIVHLVHTVCFNKTKANRHFYVKRLQAHEQARKYLQKS